MTKREWQVGDLAVVTTKSGKEYRAAYQLAPGIDYFWESFPGEAKPNALSDPDVNARPLVVIDPEDREAVERLAKAVLIEARGHRIDRAILEVGLTKGLAEHANPKPPKPEEPKGLGAVVEDDRGVRWVRTESAKGTTNPWSAALHAKEPDRVRQLGYGEINAVKVLSEGVDAQ